MGSELLLSGDVAPGASPGILSVAADFTLDADDSFRIEVGGTNAGNGTGYHDQLEVAGEITIGSNVTLHATNYGEFVLSAGDQFTIVANDGTDAVVGTFASLPEGGVITTFLGSSLDATISYVGGDGNDVVLTADVPIYDFYAPAFQTPERDTNNNTNSVSVIRSGADEYRNVRRRRVEQRDRNGRFRLQCRPGYIKLRSRRNAQGGPH